MICQSDNRPINQCDKYSKSFINNYFVSKKNGLYPDTIYNTVECVVQTNFEKKILLKSYLKEEAKNFAHR